MSPTPTPALASDVPMGARPLSARGERTRAKLIAAARVVFERDGYIDSRLTDITDEAKMSIGTFYTWFDGKEEVLAAVLHEAKDEMLHPGTARMAPKDDPAGIISESNRAYFEAYKRNAKLNHLLTQVALVDGRFAALRRARTEAFVDRNARAIADLQRRGLADPELDPQLASMGLSGMVSRLASESFRTGSEDADIDTLVRTATALWTNALGMTSRPPRAP